MSFSKRKFLTTSATILSGAGIIAATIPFIRALSPTGATRAENSPIRVDISKLTPGNQMIVQWGDTPVWILRRTNSMLNGLDKVRSLLKDPDSTIGIQQPDYTQNTSRSINPEYFICIGLCTHLGCTPSFRPEVAPSDLGNSWQGGYFCTCHGSRFDLAGRVYRDAPAPVNLEIPPHSYVNATQIVIG